MRVLLALFLFFVFYLGMFCHTNLNLVTTYVPDKHIHFIVFMVYPLLLSFIFYNKKVISVFIFMLFFSLTYLIEVLQVKYFGRSYSIVDFKYSLGGCSLGACFLLLLLLYKSLLTTDA